MKVKGSLSLNDAKSSQSVMSSSNIRVKVPDEPSKGASFKSSYHSRTGSNQFSQSLPKGGHTNDEGESSSSEEEMFKRNRNNSRRR